MPSFNVAPSPIDDEFRAEYQSLMPVAIDNLSRSRFRLTDPGAVTSGISNGSSGPFVAFTPAHSGASSQRICFPFE